MTSAFSGDDFDGGGWVGGGSREVVQRLLRNAVKFSCPSDNKEGDGSSFLRPSNGLAHVSELLNQTLVLVLC